MAQRGRGERRSFQIGPRIRVGGTLGKIGQEVKIGAGKIASNPIVEGIAGATLGPGAAAAIGALGKALDTSHGSVGLGEIAKGGLQGGVSGLAGGAIKGGIGSIAKDGLSLGSLLKGGSAALGGAQSLLGGGAGGSGGGISLSSLVDPALGTAGLINAAQLAGKSNDYATGAMDTANKSYDSREPLRLAGVEGMLHPDAGNAAKLAGVKAVQGRGNPFAQPAPIPLSGLR